ncbi:MAG: hypothetical protein PHI97_00440 [Desulfobulbus sp.]|nr:hypothetical protein [Desulfobulbus sp.]
MGWTYMHKGSDVRAKDIIADLFNSDSFEPNSNGKINGVFKTLDIAIIHLRTAYMAVEHIKLNQETNTLDPKTRKVFAAVVLLGYRNDDHYNFGYKEMDETMGPGYYDCPRKILDLLTPTDNENSVEWRKKCFDELERKANIKKIHVKSVIKTEPITFGDGISRSNFQILSLRPLRAICIETQTTCILRKDHLIGAEIIQ